MVAFAECRQETSETFDDFYIRLKGLVEAAEITTELEKWMTVRILAGSRDAEAKQKLFAVKPLPTLQQAVDICRIEESARLNVHELEGSAAVARLPVYRRRREKTAQAASGARCFACAKKTHKKDEKCPAIGKKCHRCDEFNHFAPCCPSKPKFVKAVTEGVDIAKVGSVAVRNIQGKPQRRAPTISLPLLDRKGKCISTVNNATPDGGAEVTVAGMDVLRALGLSERDLQRPTFDLVQADKSTQLLSVGQLDLPVRYESATATMTVVFCPEIKGILIS